MPSLKLQIEKAKKVVEVAKKKYEKAKPTPAKFEELGFGHMNERNIEEWVRQNRASKNYKEERAKPAIKALEELEAAESRLRLLENRVKKGGKTLRSKQRRGTRKNEH
jgi:hypothetical protein